MSEKLSVVKFEKKLTKNQQKVQDDIVNVLEQMLVRAKNGDFVGVIIAAASSDNTSTFVCSETEHFTLMLGAVAHAQHRFSMRGQSISIVDEEEDD